MPSGPPPVRITVAAAHPLNPASSAATAEVGLAVGLGVTVSVDEAVADGLGVEPEGAW
jgi:hypothetical protein